MITSVLSITTCKGHTCAKNRVKLMLLRKLVCFVYAEIGIKENEIMNCSFHSSRRGYE